MHVAPWRGLEIRLAAVLGVVAVLWVSCGALHG